MGNKDSSAVALRVENLRSLIYRVRGVEVMLDRDLADLYQVETRALKQAVKRNTRRFPGDFMIVLDDSEVEMLVSQSVIPSKQVLGGAVPFAFTEQGVASLSSVLTSDRAIEVNIAVMRAFVAMRRLLAESGSLLQRMNTLEKRQIANEIKTDARFDKVFDALEIRSPTPAQGIFFNGQVFDAYVFVNDLLRLAQGADYALTPKSFNTPGRSAMAMISMPGRTEARSAVGVTMNRLGRPRSLSASVLPLDTFGLFPYLNSKAA